ncbi:MAG: hypothetical protein K8T25_02010 [Planctomycetia bacterium]|nr:hypothetical protein [Planctomycetia bacterium]
MAKKPNNNHAGTINWITHRIHEPLPKWLAERQLRYESELERFVTKEKTASYVLFRGRHRFMTEDVFRDRWRPVVQALQHIYRIQKATKTADFQAIVDAAMGLGVEEKTIAHIRDFNIGTPDAAISRHIDRHLVQKRANSKSTSNHAAKRSSILERLAQLQKENPRIKSRRRLCNIIAREQLSAETPGEKLDAEEVEKRTNAIYQRIKPNKK